MHTVLVVDDDAELREGLRVLLRFDGIEVLEAGTLREASRLNQLYEPALILLDGMLPDGNGIEWISKLRSEGSNVDIAFMSSFFAKGRWLDVLSKLNVTHRINKRDTPIQRIAEIVRNTVLLES